MLVAGVAYLLKDYHWKWLQAAVTAPTLVYLIYPFFIPESPRWQLRAQATTAQRSAAHKTILKIARINGKLNEIVSEGGKEKTLETKRMPTIALRTADNVGINFNLNFISLR